MCEPKVILIDMDDTLFDEVDYVKSGFKAVAAYLEENRDLPADYSYPSMIAFFELEGRGAIFDRIIERFEVRNSEGLVEECINVYRNHVPDIQPYGGARETLKTLTDKYKTGLVTNGLPLMQRHKLTALGIDRYFDTVIFCDENGASKPDPSGLMRALELMGAGAHEAVMVGDNPVTDGLAAYAAGVRFIRVRTSRFMDTDNHQVVMGEVSSITQLPAFLEKTGQ